MARQKRYNRKKDLLRVPVLIEETGITSKYFQIYDVPEELPQGKSSFLIGGSQLLVPQIKLQIEIIDSKGGVIYTQPVFGYTEGTSKRIAIEVYEDTPPGRCQLVVLGEIDPSKVDFNIPAEFRGKYNLRYTRDLSVNLTIPNTLPIRFYRTPKATIEANSKGVIELDVKPTETVTITGNGRPKSHVTQEVPITNIDGSITYPGIDSRTKNIRAIIEQNKASAKEGGGGNFLTIPPSQQDPPGDYTLSLSSTQKADVSMIGQDVLINSPSVDYSNSEISSEESHLYNVPSAFSSSVLDVTDENTLTLLDSFYVTKKGEEPPTKIPAALEPVSISATRQPEATGSESVFNFYDVADILLTDLRNFSGDVNKVRIYTRSDAAQNPSQWNFIKEIFTEAKEELYDTGSLLRSGNMGYFISQDKIGDHWQGYSGEFGGSSGGAISLTRDNSKLMNAMDISGSNRTYQHDLLVQSKKPMSLQKNVRYEVSMKVYGDAKSKLKGTTTDTTKGKLQIFISGSGISANTDLPKNYGRLLGNLELPSDESNGQGSYNFDFVEASYISRAETNAFLQLRMPSGRWKVAEISVKPATSTNFSPEVFKCFAELPVAQQRPDFYQFLVEFYDVNNNKADTTAISERIKFDGANLTIQGEDNLLSGSMFIGNTLLSGIEAGGGNSAFIRSLGYFGFDKAESLASGGFMFWSGSVIKDHETYDGVGIELHNDETSGSGNDSYLQFRTKDKNGNSKFRVRTNEFFFGNEGQHISGSGGNIQISSSKFYLGSDTQYVSGSDGNIEISSSNFHLTSEGDVTMSGTITADAGHIAGWQIVGDALSGSNITLDAAGAGLFKSDAGPDAYPTTGYYIDFTPGTNYYIRMGPHFAVSSSGVLIASGAKIEGQLTASSGLIANWNIGDNAIYKYTTSNTWTGMSSTGPTRFFAGATTLAASSSAPFNVKESGEVTASSGLIGGWSLSSNKLVSPNSRMTMSANPGNERITVRKSATSGSAEMVRIGEISDAAGDLYGIKIYDGTGVYNDDTKQGQVVLLGEQGNMIGGWEITDTQIRSIPDAGFGGDYYEGESGLVIHSSGRLESADFASNLKGWRIDSLGNGTAEFENARIRGTLSTAVFEKESVNVVGGQLMVANASALGALKSGSVIIAGAETASASDVTMSMDNVSGFAEGEVIKAKVVGETGFSVEYLYVTGSMRFSHPSSSVSESLAEYDLGAIDPDGTAGEIYVGRAYGGTAAISSSVSTITEPMTQSATSGSTEKITVASSASFSDQQIIKIDDERMKIVSADGLNTPSGSGTANTMVVLRDYNDTDNMAHADNSAVWVIDTDKEFLAGLVSTAQPYNSGQVFVSTGKYDSDKRGSGYILMNANPNDMSTPYIDIVERTGSGVYDLSLKTRLGDLSGLSSAYLYGDDEPGFGIYTENGFFSGAITAQTGSFAGVVHVATVQGGLETGEKISIGRQVSGNNDGIYINNNNYWYTTGAWKVGGGTNYLSLDNATDGNIDIRSETFNLSTSKLLLRSEQNNGMLSLGSTPNLDVSGSNAGIYMDGTGDFLLYGDASNYFKKDGTDIDIKAETFDLATSRMVLDSTATGSGRIALGVSPPASITSGEGFYADGVGNFLLGAASGDHLSWNAATSVLTIKGVIRQTSAGATLTDYVDRGTWAHSTAYLVNDLVQYSDGTNTSTYKCTGAHTSTNDTNSTTGRPDSATNSWAVYAAGSTGAAGSSGADAKTIITTADSLVFVKAQAGTLTPSSITVSGSGQNLTATGSWSTTAGTLTSEFKSGDLNSCTVTSGNFSDGMVVTFTTAGGDGSIKDSVTLKQLDEGSGTVQAILSNTAHVLPAASNGAVSSYAGSGTTIRVYEGATELTFVTGTPAAGQWAVSVGNTANITEGSVTDSGTYCTIGNHSGAADGTDEYVITYTITGKTANGTTFTSFTQDQSLSKSKSGADGDDGSAGTDARAVAVTMGAQSFEYNTAGTTPSPSTTTVTATALNTTGTPYYEFIVDGSSAQNSTTATYTYTPEAAYSDMPEDILVKLREGGTGTTVLARDQITVLGLKAGSDAATIMLTNEAHTLPVNTAGTVTYTGAGTDIKAWSGTTALTYAASGANTFSVVVASDTNITVGAASTVGTARRFADHSSMTADTANIVYTVTIRDSSAVATSFSKTQTFAKSHQGATGAEGDDGDAGAGVVYRGDFDTGDTYSSTATRKDVVKYSSNYYICNTNGATGAWVSGEWDAFGAEFTSVATDVLLAQDATITRGLVIGTDGANSGFIRSTNAAVSSGTGFYFHEAGTSWLGARGGSYIGISSSGVVTAAGFTITTDYLTSNTSKSTYNSATSGVFLGTAGIGLGTGQFTVSAAGALHAISGDIGGWSLADGYLYGLTSGTPTSSPTDGIVFKSGGNSNIRVYEDGDWRLQIGYLASGVYGIAASSDTQTGTYAEQTAGDHLIFELSDNATQIGGWNFTSVSLQNQQGTNSSVEINAKYNYFAFRSGSYGSANSDGLYDNASINTEVNQDSAFTNENTSYTTGRDSFVHITSSNASTGFPLTISTINTAPATAINETKYAGIQSGTTRNDGAGVYSSAPSDANMWKTTHTTTSARGWKIPADTAVRVSATFQVIGIDEVSTGASSYNQYECLTSVQVTMYNNDGQVIGAGPQMIGPEFMQSNIRVLTNNDPAIYTYFSRMTGTIHNVINLKSDENIDGYYYKVFTKTYAKNEASTADSMNVTLQSQTITSWDTKTVLSQKGLQVFNGPYQALRAGSGDIEITGNQTVKNYGNTGGRLMVTKYQSINNGLEINPEYNLYVGSTSTTGSEGSIGTTKNIVAYVSDKRLKDDITPISTPIEKIKQIGGYNFTWGTGSVRPGEKDVGVISQEVEEIMPEVIRNFTHRGLDVKKGATPGTFKSVLYDRMVPLLVEGIKEQQNQIDYLKDQLNSIVCGSLEPR